MDKLFPKNTARQDPQRFWFQILKLLIFLSLLNTIQYQSLTHISSVHSSWQNNQTCSCFKNGILKETINEIYLKLRIKKYTPVKAIAITSVPCQ